MSQLILEGAWEEIMQRAAEFAGSQVRLIVLDKRQPELERPLAEALQGIVGTIGSTEDSPDRQPPTPFTDTLADKFRKQGLIIP